jgi:hypothetical protein
MGVARRFGATVSGTGIRATSCAAIVWTVTVWRFFCGWPPSRVNGLGFAGKGHAAATAAGLP